MAELVATNLSLKRSNKWLIDNVDLALMPGQMTAIIGENGAGKSTLLRVLAGYEPPDRGDVQVNGKTLRGISATSRARYLTWLPQNVAHAWPIRVRDAVALGLKGAGGGLGGHDQAFTSAIEDMLAASALTELAERSTHTLSGGEMARVHVARTLISGAPIALFDEPVAALDPRYRHLIMEILQRYARNGASVLVVLHDLALAARYADHIIAMRHGQVIAKGPAEAVITRSNVTALFNVDCHIDHSHGYPTPIYR